MNSSGIPDLTAFLDSEPARRFTAAGQIVRTGIVKPFQAVEPYDSVIESLLSDPADHMILEHETIPFPSFPYEWPAEMLNAAAELTLDLALEFLDSGMGLKDATPYNVLFRGPEPVFVDVLSFERRDPHDPIWLPYAQFARTFLLPLLVSKYCGVRLDQVLLTSRDGLEPETAYRWLKPLQKIRPPFLTLVSIPTWLAGTRNATETAIYRKRSLPNQEKAQFILRSFLRRLRRSLDRAQPREGARSTWSSYMTSAGQCSYSAEQHAAKRAFVEQALREFSPKNVLDVGCNTGLFSLMAAQAGARVVSIDQDPVVVGELWRKARSERLDILPLVLSLARPSPGVGWRNRECPSFLDRALGAFDAVLMLAVIHHMLITERIPLADIIDLAAELTTDLLVIEFIGPEDEMFRRLTRGRDALHRDVSQTDFEATCRRRFDIVRNCKLEGLARWLYLLRKKDNPGNG